MQITVLRYRKYHGIVESYRQHRRFSKSITSQVAHMRSKGFEVDFYLTQREGAEYYAAQAVWHGRPGFKVWNVRGATFSEAFEQLVFDIGMDIVAWDLGVLVLGS